MSLNHTHILTPGPLHLLSPCRNFPFLPHPSGSPHLFLQVFMLLPHPPNPTCTSPHALHPEAASHTT